MSRAFTYRVPGTPSGRSLLYLGMMEGMTPPYSDVAIEDLRKNLIRFESASILGTFEDALQATITDIDKGHHPFLQILYKHIRALALAERGEELLRKASTPDKESIAANALLARFDGVPEGDAPPGSSAEINFIVNEPKSEIKVTRGG